MANILNELKIVKEKMTKEKWGVEVRTSETKSKLENATLLTELKGP